MKLIITYAVLALISLAGNIGSQELIVRLYCGAFDILASVAVGTGVGLVIKYVLDKRYIFCFRARDAAHGGKIFALYSMMGLVTTLIFWVFEFGFDHFFGTKEMRYLGGIIGLVIGYVVKYYLDKRYVFRSETV